MRRHRRLLLLQQQLLLLLLSDSAEGLASHSALTTSQLRCEPTLVTCSGLSAPLSVLESRADPDELLERAISDPSFDVYSAQLWPAAYAATCTLLRHLSAHPGRVVELG
jgi:hypothetical protein|tara:strand:- start:587 stop:913 length:327 start_codon:yes stop_codon:yes gene_type:complete